MCHHIQCWRYWTRTLCKPWKQSMVSYVPSYITLLRSISAHVWGLTHTLHWKKEQSCWPCFLKKYTAFPIYTQDGEREAFLAFSQPGRGDVEILQRARATCGLEWQLHTGSVSPRSCICLQGPSTTSHFLVSPYVSLPTASQDRQDPEWGREESSHPFPSSYDAHLPLLPLLP